MITGDMTSPRAWMTKMFSAKPTARIEGCVTFARIVLVGPVLKNRQKTVRKIRTHIQGNGAWRAARMMGKPSEHRRAGHEKIGPAETAAQAVADHAAEQRGD